jgi:hypothetical protein
MPRQPTVEKVQPTRRWLNASPHKGVHAHLAAHLKAAYQYQRGGGELTVKLAALGFAEEAATGDRAKVIPLCQPGADTPKGFLAVAKRSKNVAR